MGWGSKSKRAIRAPPPEKNHRGSSKYWKFCRGFLRGGVKEGAEGGGGFHTRVRGTMFVRNGAVTPRPSRECDITFFVKGRPNSARQSRDSTVAALRVESVTVPSSRVSRECRSPGLRSPPSLKKCPILHQIKRKAFVFKFASRGARGFCGSRGFECEQRTTPS